MYVYKYIYIACIYIYIYVSDISLANHMKSLPTSPPFSTCGFEGFGSGSCSRGGYSGSSCEVVGI